MQEPRKGTAMIRQKHGLRWLLLGAGLMVLAGCNEAASRRQIDRRVGNIEATCKQLRQAEAARPNSLAWTLQTLRDQHRRDTEACANNASRVDKMVEDEFERWNKRQPAYHKAIEKQLQGDCEGIGRTAPQMAW